MDGKGDEKLIPFLIHRPQPDPEVKGLPIIPELIKGEDNLSAYNTWVGTFEFQRPFHQALQRSGFNFCAKASLKL